MTRPSEDRATDPDDPLIGTVLEERYRVIRKIGAGGMGVVYEAEHEVLKTRVALKLLHAAYTSEPGALARLRREAQSASQIGSPHIVDVRDFGRAPDGSAYMVLELIEGESLFDELLMGPLPWRRAARIAVQVAEALDAAHAEGITHRDLKPENILLTTRDGESDFVKVVDFGIALMQGTAKITVDGEVVGTPQFMSPEQCAGLEVDSRTDIYSLGVVLYQMITGRLPFQDRSLARLIASHLNEAPPPPSKVASGVEIPLSLEATILRCLAKRPDDRFPTMRALADSLRELTTPEVSPRGPTVALAPVSNDGQTLDDEEDEASPFVAAKAAVELETEDAPAASNARAVTAALIASSLLFGLGLGGFVLWNRSDPVRPESEHRPAATRDPIDEERPAPEPTPAAGAHVDAIVIESDPDDAEVYEDDAFVGNTPYRFARPEGDARVRLEIRQRGFRTRDVTINAMSQPTLHVELEPIAHGSSASEDSADPPTPPSPPPNNAPPNNAPPNNAPPNSPSPSGTDRGPFFDPWR